MFRNVGSGLDTGSMLFSVLSSASDMVNGPSDISAFKFPMDQLNAQRE